MENSGPSIRVWPPLTSPKADTPSARGASAEIVTKPVRAGMARGPVVAMFEPSGPNGSIRAPTLTRAAQGPLR